MNPPTMHNRGNINSGGVYQRNIPFLCRAAIKIVFIQQFGSVDIIRHFSFSFLQVPLQLLHGSGIPFCRSRQYASIQTLLRKHIRNDTPLTAFPDTLFHNTFFFCLDDVFIKLLVLLLSSMVSPSFHMFTLYFLFVLLSSSSSSNCDELNDDM